MALIRLLNTDTLELEEHLDSNLPRDGYAILSHCWLEPSSSEVVYKDLMSGIDFTQKPGFAKLKAFCELARAQGWRYAWADTACINKDSTTELASALMSMYNWYAEAGTCIAYMSEVEPGGKTFLEDRWFTRGWTLQELIAPRRMLFYDKSWTLVGKKSRLTQQLSDRTRIPTSVLTHKSKPGSCSVAQRMSWAANRSTKRIEDRAYSLLGLFDVTMPMIYGEREGAFFRLQKEIIAQSTDQTIFAWTLDLQQSPSGLFAPSPDAFAFSHNIVQNDQGQEFTLRSQGLNIELPTLPYSIDVYQAFLDCEDQNDRATTFSILLARLPTKGQWVRVASNDGESLLSWNKKKVREAGLTDRKFCVKPNPDLYEEPIAFRRTNGFWIRTIEPPHHEQANSQILSRSGAPSENRVYFGPGQFGTAGIVYLKKKSRSVSSSWSWVRGIWVGFADDFTPIVRIANHQATGSEWAETFQEALEAGSRSAAHRKQFDGWWTTGASMRTSKDWPSVKDAWPGGHFITRAGSDIGEGETRTLSIKALNLKIRLSLLMDLQPTGSGATTSAKRGEGARGAAVGLSKTTEPRYIWTLDLTPLREDPIASPEMQHYGAVCCLSIRCPVMTVGALSGGFCLWMQALDDCEALCPRACAVCHFLCFGFSEL